MKSHDGRRHVISLSKTVDEANSGVCCVLSYVAYQVLLHIWSVCVRSECFIPRSIACNGVIMFSPCPSRSPS